MALAALRKQRLPNLSQLEVYCTIATMDHLHSTTGCPKIVFCLKAPQTSIIKCFPKTLLFSLLPMVQMRLRMLKCFFSLLKWRESTHSEIPNPELILLALLERRALGIFHYTSRLL